MWPATLPTTLRRMPVTMLSRNDVPTTTSRAPNRMMPPTMTVFRRLANRLRTAIFAITPRRALVPAISGRSRSRNGAGHAGSGRFGRRQAIEELAVGQAHHAAGMRHHAGVVGREDEGGALGDG